MKILLITNGYPPHRWAGTETYTAGIAEALLARGYTVKVLCAGGWETGSECWNGHSDEVYHGVAVRRVNLNWTKSPDPFRYLYDNPVVANHLASYLSEYWPDLVHVTSCETLSASVLRVVKEVTIPLVLSLTDFWFLCPRINLLRSDGDNCDGLTTAWECLRCQLLGSKAYLWPRRILTEKSTSRLLTAVARCPSMTRQRGLRGLAGDMEARKAFLHEALSLPDCRITASRFVRDLFYANGIKDPIRVQPYGHDLSSLTRYRGKTSSDTIRLGFIGQIVEHKGVHLLLQAARRLQEDGFTGQFDVWIYGNLDKTPEYGARLRALAANMSCVRFCGTYPHDQSANVFADIDTLVVPSLWYDFPLVVHEAFATGTPVIASNLGGMTEAVTHEVNGLLFERNNVEDLSNQLRRLMCERNLLKQLCAGIPKVKTIEEEVAEIESIYTDLLAGKHATVKYSVNSIQQLAER
jgi:glycosyltransferase involved in cell wall biosynthesis